MQEPVLWGAHYVAGKHLLFSCMLTIFYKAANSHLNLIPFLLASLVRSNKGEVFIKSGYRFRTGHCQGLKESLPTGAVNASLAESHQIQMKMGNAMVCYSHKGTQDTAKHILTLRFLIAVLKRSLVPRKR